METLSIAEAAAKLGAGISTIRRRAALMGIPKIGRDYRLTADQIEAIRGDLQAPGRRGPKVKGDQPKAKGRKRKGPHPDRVAAVRRRYGKRNQKRGSDYPEQGQAFSNAHPEMGQGKA